jgi:hypothetical protein
MTKINNLKLNGIIFALFLISLDAYSFGNISIQWMGLSVLLFLLLFFFVIPVEEFNAFTSLIFGYVFKMLNMGGSS